MKKPYFASKVVICEECTCLADVLNIYQHISPFKSVKTEMHG